MPAEEKGTEAFFPEEKGKNASVPFSPPVLQRQRGGYRIRFPRFELACIRRWREQPDYPQDDGAAKADERYSQNAEFHVPTCLPQGGTADK